MKIASLVLLLALALPSHLFGGDDPRLRRLEQLRAIPPESLTSAQTEETLLLSFSLTLDHLVESLTDPDKAKLAGLHPVIIPVEGSSPVIVEGTEVRVSTDYLASLATLLTLLTHDLYVTHLESFETSNHLLEHPFEVSAVAPLMAPLRTYLDSPFGFAHMSLLSCPKSYQDCQDLRIPAFTSILSFIFNHEIAHILLGHVKRQTGHTLEEEMEADSVAWTRCQRLNSEFPTDNSSFKELIQLAFLAGPILSLQYQLFNDKGQEVPGIARRRDALLARVSEDLQDEVTDLVLPKRSKGNARRLQLRWEDLPQRLWIDGVEIPPAEVSGRDLLVTGSRHEIFAWSEAGMAQESVRAGASRQEVLLRFRKIAESPAPLEGLQALKRERRWFDLLLQTSSTMLKPKENNLFMLHAEALHWMGLSDLIELPPDGIVSAAEKRKLRLWVLSHAPLTHWR